MKYLPLVFALSCCLLLGACGLSRPAVEIRSYMPAPTAARAPQTLDARAGRFDVAAPFAGKPLVWRLGETRFESDFYNELAATPRAILMERTESRFALRAATDQHALRPPRYVLAAYLAELYGDARTKPAQAAIQVRYTLSTTGEAPRIVFRKEYTERADLARADGEELARGYGVVMDRVLGQLQADLKGLPEIAQ